MENLVLYLPRIGSRKRDGVKPDEIIYIRAEDHYARVHTIGGGVYLWRMPLSEIEKLLSGLGFVRCHRSYVVNRRYVLEMRRKQLALKGGWILPVGRKFKMYYCS